MVFESKASLWLKTNEPRYFITKEVHRLDNYCVPSNEKIDVVASATTRSIEDLIAFNKDYSNDLKVKTKKGEKMFEKVEVFLINFKETLSKVDLPCQSSISQESISAMVSSIESCFKEKLAPILNLVIRLPINATCLVHVSQGGERGVGSSRGLVNEIWVIVGRVLSTQILIYIPMKPVVLNSTNPSQENIVQKKGILIN